MSLVSSISSQIVNSCLGIIFFLAISQKQHKMKFFLKIYAFNKLIMIRYVSILVVTCTIIFVKKWKGGQVRPGISSSTLVITAKCSNCNKNAPHPFLNSSLLKGQDGWRFVSNTSKLWPVFYYFHNGTKCTYHKANVFYFTPDKNNKTLGSVHRGGQMAPSQ